jgi:prepilin-type N-terminal cleavage/methylation domain-containing protein
MGIMRNVRGFTLIELMVTLAVLAVLAVIAIPDLSNFAVRSQRQQAISDISSAIALARSEAIKRGAAVTLAATSTGAQALQNGWRVFTDPNRTGVFDATAGSATQLIADQGAYPSGELKIGRIGTGVNYAGGAEYLMFDGLGKAITNTSASGAYGLSVLVERGAVTKLKSALCIGWAGRVRVVEDKANNDTGGCAP